MTEQRTCGLCGESLAGRRRHARYCSGACRAEASRIRLGESARAVSGTRSEAETCIDPMPPRLAALEPQVEELKRVFGALVRAKEEEQLRDQRTPSGFRVGATLGDIIRSSRYRPGRFGAWW
jgi:hypothetical protein